MKRTLFLYAMLLFPFITFCQDDYSARIPTNGVGSELGIPPSEEVWIATTLGNTYYCESVGKLWHLGPNGPLKSNSYSTGKSFERINFFSEDTMMISGFIQENGLQNFVYWSGDHGITWEKVIFGESSWIDAAYVNNNGKAWMSGSSQLIYYSEDYGKTWKTFDKVEATGKLRFTTIHFADDEKTGLFGSSDGALYQTTNNCQNWMKLPTPLSQKKYETTSKEIRPRINKIRIYGDNYFINQQGKVFISNVKNINWVYLPEIQDFEVSDNEEIYVVNSDLSIAIYDAQFHKIWDSKQKLEIAPRAIGVRNQKLFAFSGHQIFKISRTEFTSSQLLTDDIKIKQPYIKQEFEGEVYGFDAYDVLKFDTRLKEWFRFMTLDVYVHDVSVFKSNLLVTNYSQKNPFVINTKTKSIEQYKIPVDLFLNKSVTEIHLEQGSRGCFHGYSNRRIYKKEGHNFKLDSKSSDPKYLSETSATIPSYDVQQLVKTIDASRLVKLTLADLKITKSDINEYKSFMNEEEKRSKSADYNWQYYSNPYSSVVKKGNFDFYRSMVDSLNQISDADIDTTFWQTDGITSTTVNWNKVTFIFEDGEMVEVQNSDYRPNYLNAPWRVDYEGLEFRTNSIQLGQQIYKVTDGLFFDEVVKDKNYAIYKIIEYQYLKKLNANSGN